jgi:hypothetical protein
LNERLFPRAPHNPNEAAFHRAHRRNIVIAAGLPGCAEDATASKTPPTPPATGNRKTEYPNTRIGTAVNSFASDGCIGLSIGPAMTGSSIYRAAGT